MNSSEISFPAQTHGKSAVALPFVDEFEATAYHEAGHAILGQLYGFTPSMVSIEPEGDSLGRACTNRRTTSCFRIRNGILHSPLTREKAGKYAVSVVAGIIAEAKFTGGSWKKLRKTSGKRDYETVNRIAEKVLFAGNGFAISDDVRKAYIMLWEQQAIAILNQPMIWSRVETVATQLFDRDQLNAQEIEAAIISAESRDVEILSNI